MTATELSRLDAQEFSEELRKVAKRDLSPEEFREQAISFIMGSKSNNDTRAREQIRENLIKQFGS